MRGLSLERKILLLMVVPILGGLIPGGLLLFRANRNLSEMHTLEQLSSLVDRLSEIEARLHQEGSNWFIFNPTRALVGNEERTQERKKTDGWRRATDAAIVNYQKRLAATDSRIFSPMLQEALARIDARCAGLSALRAKVDNQADEAVGSAIMAGYRDFESDVNAVLPHLIDDTTSDVIVRKLTVIPKLMLVQKMMTESGGMVFYYHQLRQNHSKRTFTPSEAIEMIHNADLAEREWVGLIALSQGKQREHLMAVHDSADWRQVSALVRAHGVAALDNTEPPIPDLSAWDPRCWNFINAGLDAEIAALRADFTETCSGMERTARHQRLLFSICMLVGVGLMFGMTRVLAHSLGRPIIAMTQQLLQDAERSSAEAKMVRDSSSSVAEGSTSQAAALGQTTATLDSISAVARSNAQNAEEAQRVARETRAAAEHGTTRIERLREAMDGLRESGADVTRIIKTIDEIAFQTNILALNAAVEAARAGEAGAGFAVVADEVRSLAKRSADAARESTDKINAAASRTEAGVSITQETVETLNGILEKARAVEGRVNSIAEATREQKSGIDQIAGAVAEIDRVTHRNASAADQTANSAQELLVRADGFRVAVYRLRAIVFGGGAQRRSQAKPAAEPMNRLAQDKNGLTVHPFRKRAEGVKV